MKVLAVVVLVLGAFLTVCGTQTMGMAVERPPLAVVFVMFIVVGLAVMTGGVALWGWHRRRMVYGVALTSTGGYLAMLVLVLCLLPLSPEWQTMGNKAAEKAFNMMLPGSIVSGIVFLAIGIPLIVQQRRLDRRQAAAPMPPVASIGENPHA